MQSSEIYPRKHWQNPQTVPYDESDVGDKWQTHPSLPDQRPCKMSLVNYGL